MVRIFLALSASVAILSHGAVTLATKVTFTNNCAHAIELFDNAKTDSIAQGSSTSRELANGFHGMFRHGIDSQATLAEFSIVGTNAWYDISAIPPGPGNCKSFADCKAVTGKKGFNVAVAITPTIRNGVKVPIVCKPITCEAEGCADAYLYPSDDLKTHNCPTTGVDFTVAFCPSGSAAQAVTAPATTPAPTIASVTPVVASTKPAATLKQPVTQSKQTTPVVAATAAPATKTPSMFTNVGNDYQSGAVTTGLDTAATTASTSTASLAGAAIKSSFSYNGVLAGNVAGSYDMVTSTNACTKTRVAVQSPVGPLSEEVSMVFRGPMAIHNIAVFTPAPGNSSSSSDWHKVSSFSDTGESSNILFLNNLNVDYSSGKKSPQGFASADGGKKAVSATAFTGKLADASNPSNTFGGPGIATGAEVNVLLPKKCSDTSANSDGSALSACKGYYDDNGYHGWDGGKKVFVTKVHMPMSSSSAQPNLPAIWMLNAQVLRSNQYGCNCRGMGAVGGCGELDIAEVIETNSARDKVSTHYYFYDGTHPAGRDNFGARPTDAATTYVTIVDDSGDGAIQIIEIGGDAFDFNATSLSAATIANWLRASDKNVTTR